MSRGDPPLVFYGQTFTALSPSAVDKGATALGRHALEKSMGARTLDSAGLISTFHFLRPFIFAVKDVFKKISRKALSGIMFFTIGNYNHIRKVLSI